MLAPPTVSDATVIESDIPCIGCQYNLRTQHVASACPECGRSVLESRDAYVLHHSELGPLRASGLPWLRAMRRGVNTAFVAWCLALVGFLFAAGPDAPYGNEHAEAILWLAPLVTVWVVSHWAAWHFMFARNRRWSLRVGRLLNVLAVASVGLLFLNDRFVRFYERLLTPRSSYYEHSWTRVTEACGGMLFALWPLIAAATFGRLVQIAWVARHRVSAVLLALIGIIVAGIQTLIAYSYLLYGFHRYMASGDVAPLLIGPTGSVPFVWTGLVFLFRDPPPLAQIELPYLLLILLAIVVIYGGTLCLGVIFWLLRSTLNRAILLSEESEASFRSSPSPHPEVQSR